MSEHLRKYQAYGIATQTVAKTRQIVMLYDAVIRNIRQSMDAIAAGKYEERFHLLGKSSEIILGLQGALDFENGGDVAQSLYDFYGSIDQKIHLIQRNNNGTICEEIAAEIKQMRDVWNQIDHAQAPASLGRVMDIDATVAAGNETGHVSAMACITA